MSDGGKCPICKEPRKGISQGLGDFDSFECVRCGTFSLTRTAEAALRHRPPDPKLSAWLRQQFETGAPQPQLDSFTLEEIRSYLPDYTPSQKQLRFLKNIEIKTKYPGSSVPLTLDWDYPLAWANTPKELLFYIDALLERGLLKAEGSKNAAIFVITPDGWNFLDQHARTSVISNQAFVAMSFEPELKPVWENAIKKAVERAGYTPFRIDADPHSDRIDVKIMSEIKASRFLIADVTKHRQGVYFEAGYALGLGIPVIWTVQEDDLENAHFDTRQYSHLKWVNEDVLRDTLYDWICAIIGGLVRK